MKATDLMIGDWVNWEKGNMLTPCKIGIGDLMYVEEHAVAIPLTPDILEKNGFDKKFPNLFEMPHLGKCNLYVGIGNDTFVPNSKGVTIYVMYVHELQHALHLCGLKEMANKFEI